MDQTIVPSSARGVELTINGLLLNYAVTFYYSLQQLAVLFSLVYFSSCKSVI